MKNKIILDLCGGSGAWSKPYKEAGYEVDLITLPRYDVTKVEFDTNAMRFIWQDVHWRDCTTVLYSDVYGIFAAPPCAEFSVAKNARLRDLEKGMETVEACIRIIWETQKRTTLKFWALENPRGLLRRFLGKPKYTFEQWQFGGHRRKATDIWGYFNTPTPTIKSMPDGMTKQDCKSRVHAADWGKVEYPPEYDNYINQFKGNAKRSAARAITPAGFADAFYEANK